MSGGFDALHPSVQHHVVNTLGWSSLRPLQGESVAPILAGEDALLLAPTAGGKTEAAMFPLLTRIASEEWHGESVLYLCPLKALLNNLQSRLAMYAAWIGRSAATRHGDTGAGARRRQLAEPPAVLLTTPESLEVMLTSTLTDTSVFRDVRAVVIDEVHAFAGDDRGWHLLALLDRIEKIAGRRLQRVGLSATVGNPERLLHWLQGRSAGHRPARVVAPAALAASSPELTLDYVGSPVNAAKVIAALHRGSKRLVFCDSRKTVEDVAVRLRDLDVQTFVSHSSLSIDERRRAEEAFAQARDCVIVSTSTLELGIDVGDLDHVIQIGAPGTVASLLQRLGRTGRRPGTQRNMTFLALDDQQLLRAAGLLRLLGGGFVEPIEAPPAPLHIAAQQMLARCLEQGRVDLGSEMQWLSQLGLGTPQELQEIAEWLLASGHLDSDGGLSFVGQAAERRYGARNFMEVLAVFSAPPEIVALHGRTEIGSLDPSLLATRVDGPRLIVLAGRAWRVTHIDWKHRRAFVEPSDQVGRARWGGTVGMQSFALAGAVRDVLLRADLPGVTVSERASMRLRQIHDEYAPRVLKQATVVRDEPSGRRWWTFAGLRINEVLAAALDDVAPELCRDGAVGNWSLPVAPGVSAGQLAQALARARERFGETLADVTPAVSEDALRGLKFAEMLPPHLAIRTLGRRLGEPVELGVPPRPAG